MKQLPCNIVHNTPLRFSTDWRMLNGKKLSSSVFAVSSLDTIYNKVTAPDVPNITNNKTSVGNFPTYTLGQFKGADKLE